MPADVVSYKGKEFFDKLIEKSRESNGQGATPSPGFANGGLIRGYALGGLVDEADTLALPESASPGLETLPEIGTQPDAGLGFAPPQEAVAPVELQVAPMDAPPPTSGAGMSNFKAARTEDDKAYLHGLPTAQKIGLLLQSLGAGINGQASPVDALLENKRRREVEFRNELRTTIEATKAGMDVVRKMPPGKARDAMIEQIARASGATGGVVTDALKSVGTDSEREIRDAVAVVGNPRVQALLVKAVAKSPDPLAAAQRLMADDDFMKRAERTADADTMPSLTGKMRVLGQAMEKMGLKTYTYAELQEQNAKLSKEFQLSDAELSAARRNQDALAIYGLKSPKMLEEERKRTEKAEEQKKTDNRRQEDKEDLARLTAALRPTEPLESIIGPDGKPKLVTRSEAIGKEPASKGGTEKQDAARAKAVTQLSKGLEQAKLPEANAVLANVETALKAAPDLAGYLTGPKSLLPDMALPENIRAGRQALTKLFNIELKNRSGAAVTVPEFERLKDEFGRGVFKTAKQIEGAVAQAREILGTHYRSVAAGFGPEVLQEYNDNLTAIGGKPVIDISPPGGGGALAAQAKAAWGSYEPTKYDYRVVNGKLQRKSK